MYRGRSTGRRRRKASTLGLGSGSGSGLSSGLGWFDWAGANSHSQYCEATAFDAGVRCCERSMRKHSSWTTCSTPSPHVPHITLCAISCTERLSAICCFEGPAGDPPQSLDELGRAECRGASLVINVAPKSSTASTCLSAPSKEFAKQQSNDKGVGNEQRNLLLLELLISERSSCPTCLRLSSAAGISLACSGVERGTRHDTPVRSCVMGS